MVDILIKGIELQDNWELLSINIDRNGKVTQSLDLKCKQIAEAAIVPRHGRLIDVDKLIAKMRPFYKAVNVNPSTGEGVSREYLLLISAPIVIEASKDIE